MARSKTAARSKAGKAAENKAQDNAKDLVKDIVTDIAPDLPVSVKAGDYVRFGSFPQNKKRVKEPIEWLVLEVKGNEALLVSRYALQCIPYHHKKECMTWEDCDLRKWLNNDFLNKAFTAEEQQRIRLTEVVNDDNSVFYTSGGNDTRDRVFCLSFAEAERYFKDDSERRCQPAALVIPQCGGFIHEGCCWWWLRSPGITPCDVAIVGTDGELHVGGDYLYRVFYAVRPALRLICNLPSAKDDKAALNASGKSGKSGNANLMSGTAKTREPLTGNGTGDKAQDNAGGLAQDHAAKGSSHSPEEPMKVKTGGYVKFGSYPQNNGSPADPIEWLVLEVKGNEALLVSRYGLDCKPYNEEFADVTWEDCDLRKWLNNDFLNKAFTEEEQSRIKLSELVNDDNLEYEISGGNDTQDRIFCLSLAEAVHFFKNDRKGECRATEYARNQGSWVNSGNGCCKWWLRTPGLSEDFCSYVHSVGGFDLSGCLVSHGDYAVRPALRLIWNLKGAKHDEAALNDLRKSGSNSADNLTSGAPKIIASMARYVSGFMAGYEAGYKAGRKAEHSVQDNAKALVPGMAANESGTFPDKSAIVKSGKYIKFGTYPQNNGDIKEPIEWLILEVKGNEALLMSRYALDCQPYDNTFEETTWKDCALRKWLNIDFLNEAFTEEEQCRIRLSESVNDDNPGHGTRGGDNTKDRIFCLSITEADQYFNSDAERECRATEHARKQGDLMDGGSGPCDWWLRSPGREQDCAAFMDLDGALNLDGEYANSGCIAVRPALRIIWNPAIWNLLILESV
ncbi:DUF6273 domain-containing protein [Succinimonas sp.]|uniref:DUF6273 domain-containing protein n=1 Tax=Succinimonas sp. TaxID=1936151 RepID=UPI00386AB174